VPILQQLRPGPNHGRASSAVPPMCPAGSTFLNVRGPARLFERRAGGAAQEHGRALRGPGARSSAALPRSTVKRCSAPAHGRAPLGLGARSSAARPRRTVERCAAPAHGRAPRGPGARSSAARPRRTVERRAASAHGRALRGPGARSSAARPRRTIERRAAQEHGRALRGPGARLLRRMRYKTSCSSWGWLPKYVPTVGRRPTVGSVCHVPTSVCLYHTNAREMMRSSCQA
jgi:hypothetical protein